jgi:DNA-directed RNA polymerase subunit A'
MQPKDMILGPRDGKPVMFIEEDEIIGMYLLTKEDALFTKDDACSLLSNCEVYELPKPDRKGMYTGKSIFSMLLPKDLNFVSKIGNQSITIKNGQLVDGTVQNNFVGEGNGTLILKIFEDYGPDATTEFLLRMAKLSVRVAAIMGVTISVKDYYNSDTINKDLARIVTDVETKATELAQKYKDKKLDSLPGYTRRETLEMEVMAGLEGARTMAEQVLKKNISPDTNNTQLMASVKARGNILNFVQISMLLGQQAVRGKRPSRGYNGRVLPYFRRNDKNPVSKGFVKSSFFNGLQPIEFFMHAMGSRDSAMSKSLVIAQSGYLQRRLVNAMQDFYVDENLSVKDASGSLIQTIYGGDGIDPTKERIEE